MIMLALHPLHAHMRCAMHAPSLAWDATLMQTGVKFYLMSDMDMPKYVGQDETNWIFLCWEDDL